MKYSIGFIVSVLIVALIHFFGISAYVTGKRLSKEFPMMQFGFRYAMFAVAVLMALFDLLLVFSQLKV